MTKFCETLCTHRCFGAQVRRGVRVTRAFLYLSALSALIFATPSDAATIARHVRTAVEAGDPIWVFLKDKGPTVALPAVPSQGWISERAAARIARRGGAYDPRQDQPISDEYRHALESMGLVIRAESRWLNAIAGVLPAGRLSELAALNMVDSLHPVAIYRRPIERPETNFRPANPSGLAKPSSLDYGNSSDQIEAIEVNVLHDRGLDGRGVGIGFLDTGYSLDIDVFGSLQVIATRDFINGDSDVGDGDTVQMDHGTATLSACAGFLPGQLIGVAPKAEFALAKTEIFAQEIRIEEDYWVAGLEWVDSLGCDIVSSSLGYIKWYSPADLDGHTATTTRAAELAAQRGLLVVNAAGNEGTRGLVAPADGESVLAVGASDLFGNPAVFSSRGPTADGRIKPDVVAPGEGVWAALTRNGEFAGRSGTSFATPLVSGVCALLLQESPNLTPMQVIDLLRKTASSAEDPNNDAGWGMVRASHAANVNQPPVLDSIRAQSVAVGGNLTFRTHATDPDGATPTFTVVGAPLNSTFVDSLNGAGSFVFNPDNTQSGAFNVTFIASDGFLADSEVVAITVTADSPQLYVRPNPAEDSVWIVTPGTLADQTSRFEVLTATGEPVYSADFRGSLALWPGTNSTNQPVASGVYLVWVKTPNREGIAKVALIRQK